MISLAEAVYTSVAIREVWSCADIPREPEASLLVLVKPPPMGLLPQMPLDGCQVPPFPNVWPRVEDCGDLSSLLCLAGVELKSPNLFDRAWRKEESAAADRGGRGIRPGTLTGPATEPICLLVVAEDMAAGCTQI
ncbi:MAG: hypothetical protein OK454_12005 [Thaumarchaeota archaeon]|nr:hypothetical protein [Nitrososphaerota archaeon]